MPLRLQIGLQQKIGMPNYGSLGASCHVELELDSQILDRHPENFQQEVERTYAACRQAVREELERAQPPLAREASDSAATSETSPSPPTPASIRSATQSQARALRAIAKRQRFDLTADLEQRFGVTAPEELNIQQASRLIEEWNQLPYGSHA